MNNILAKYKPAASLRTHLLVAACIWTAMGAILVLRGWVGFPEEQRFLLFLVGMAIGTLKSLLVLDRSAARNVERIKQSREGRCIGGVYSIKMWGMVLLMVLGGRLLRVFTPDEVVWLLYLAIGWALVFSSRLIWLQWRTSS
jgi:hypothetical protein